MLMLRTKLLVAATAFATALAVPLWTVSQVDSTAMGASTSTTQTDDAGGMSMPMPDGSGTTGTSTGTSTGSADSSAATDSATMDKQMAARDKSFPAATAGVGAVDLKPKVLADGTKEFDLTAKVSKWEIEPGKTVQAWTYNGIVPGPTLNVNVGDKVRVVVHNKLPESTAVHWHGLDIANDQDGVTDVTQDPIKPGATYTYNFVPPEPMKGWYHSHDDGTKQVPNGLYGLINVGTMPVPAGVKVTQDIPMVLQDSGVIGLTINGKSFPATAPVRAKLGDWIEVTYTNAGALDHPMHLHGVPQLVIAKDGYPLASPYKADTVLVAPGERYTVLVHATNPGTWAWHCHIFSHSEGSQGMFGLFTELIVT